MSTGPTREWKCHPALAAKLAASRHLGAAARALHHRQSHPPDSRSRKRSMSFGVPQGQSATRGSSQRCWMQLNLPWQGHDRHQRSGYEIPGAERRDDLGCWSAKVRRLEHLRSDDPLSSISARGTSRPIGYVGFRGYPDISFARPTLVGAMRDPSTQSHAGRNPLPLWRARPCCDRSGCASRSVLIVFQSSHGDTR